MHKRSSEKLQVRHVRRIIFSTAFNDRSVCEVVSKVSRLDLMTLLNEPVDMSLLPDVEKGEVLVDSRGRGSFQRMH
jgi:hypothetical protein